MEKQLLKSHLVESQLARQDKELIWHPYTQHQIDDCPIPIASATGAYLFSERGECYIDAISSWWSNLHGHAHPHIAEKIAQQARTLEHVMFANYTHAPAVELAERLQAILPSGFAKFFYSDNGSTAIEAALKIALQYWHNTHPETKKTTIVAFEGAFHGDTFGAMSIAGRSPFNQPFWPLLFEVVSIPPPTEKNREKSIQDMQAVLDKGQVACFIFEPVIQGANGMLPHLPEGLDQLMRMCRAHDVLLIADEVMTGFGRTGPLFACHHLTETPDMICLSKGLTGGALPLALTVCSEKVYANFLSQERCKALLHGHTFTANPLGCAAACASLDLLLTPACTAQRDFIQEAHRSFQEKHRGNPAWQRCDVVGTILSLEYASPEQGGYFNGMRDKLMRFFTEKRLVLRPLGNTVHVVPPYCIQAEDLQCIYQALEESLDLI